MKKHVKIYLIIILFALIAGYVFISGWTQLKIHPDSCGVVKSKLGGVKEEAVLPGKFSWHWDFIIPKNARLVEFSLLPYSSEKIISGQTPVNELYTVLYNDNMNYSFNFSVSLTLSPQAIVSLVKNNTVATNQDLEKYLSNVADYVCQHAANYFLTRSQNEPTFNPESVKRSDLIRAIAIYEEYPDIDIAVLALTDYKIPNYALFTKFQNMILQDPSLLKAFVPNTYQESNNADLLPEGEE